MKKPVHTSLPKAETNIPSPHRDGTRLNEGMKNWLAVASVLLMLVGCVASKPYNPSKKFSPDDLQADYDLFRASLQDSHSSLYWYTPKDSMDYYFAVGKSKLKDSLA